MIPLTNNSSTSTQSLVIVLTASATTTYPTITVVFYDVLKQTKNDFSEYLLSNQHTLMTAATETTICTAPKTGITRNMTYINVFNADTVAAEALIAIDVNGTNRTLVQQTLQPKESLIYEGGKSGIGWHIL